MATYDVFGVNSGVLPSGSREKTLRETEISNTGRSNDPYSTSLRTVPSSQTLLRDEVSSRLVIFTLLTLVVSRRTETGGVRDRGRRLTSLVRFISV